MIERECPVVAQHHLRLALNLAQALSRTLTMVPLQERPDAQADDDSVVRAFLDAHGCVFKSLAAEPLQKRAAPLTLRFSHPV